jgi:oligopeptide/dipeptide ABC transporter ATP-binding protein
VPALLQVRDLTVRYSGAGSPVVAVDEVSLDVEAGEVVGLLGESGAGKTTLLLAILGLLPPSARVAGGSIRFRGRELVGLGASELRAVRGAEISVVFQEPSLALNPVRRVGPQVAEVVRAHRPWSGRQCRQAALETFAEVGFADPAAIYRAYPHELSGGQRQRVAVAQALVCRPALVLADEPTAALDATSQADLLALLRDLQSRLGLALLLVSHDVGAVAALAQRVIILYAGRAVEGGRTRDVLTAPLHPYTHGLLRAVPRPSTAMSSARPVPIAGSPPDLARLPPGCAFEPRCPERSAVCVIRPPREVRPGDDRHVRCFAYGG